MANYIKSDLRCDVCNRVLAGVSMYECDVCGNRYIHACPMCKQGLVLDSNPSPYICKHKSENRGVS